MPVTTTYSEHFTLLFWSTATVNHTTCDHCTMSQSVEHELQSDDAIPHHSSWTPARPNDLVMLQRWSECNTITSWRRQAKVTDLKVVNLVLVWDRHPFSKFCLLFEPTPWHVVQIQGTWAWGTVWSSKFSVHVIVC